MTGRGLFGRHTYFRPERPILPYFLLFIILYGTSMIYLSKLCDTISIILLHHLLRLLSRVDFFFALASLSTIVTIVSMAMVSAGFTNGCTSELKPWNSGFEVEKFVVQAAFSNFYCIFFDKKYYFYKIFQMPFMKVKSGSDFSVLHFIKTYILYINKFIWKIVCWVRTLLCCFIGCVIPDGGVYKWPFLVLATK